MQNIFFPYILQTKFFAYRGFYEYEVFNYTGHITENAARLKSMTLRRSENCMHTTKGYEIHPAETISKVVPHMNDLFKFIKM